MLQTENIYQDNASLAEQCKVDKKIFQWLVLDPRQEFLFEQIKSMINCSKVLGTERLLREKIDTCLIKN